MQLSKMQKLFVHQTGGYKLVANESLKDEFVFQLTIGTQGHGIPINDTAAMVWEHCEQPIRVSDLIQQFQVRYPDVPDLDADIQTVLSQLRDLRALEFSSCNPCRRTDEDETRGDMKKLPVAIHRPDTAEGYLWCLLDTDTHVSKAIQRLGAWEGPLIKKALAYTRKGSQVVDMGANCGAWTIPLAHAVGGGGSVHAFEVQRIIYQQLNCNVFLNGLSNVHTYHAAIGNVAGRMVYEPYIDYFKEGQNVGGGSVRSSVSPHAKVAATEMTLDSLGLTDVSFMKIDIEGYEYYALLGAVDTITACRPVILYEHFWDPEAHRATKNLGWQPKERFEEFFAEHDYHLVREPQGPEVFALPSELV